MTQVRETILTSCFVGSTLLLFLERRLSPWLRAHLPTAHLRVRHEGMRNTNNVNTLYVIQRAATSMHAHILLNNMIGNILVKLR